MLTKLSLPLDIIDEKVNNLSGGQKQRIAIIRALIKDSRVIVCDEPTGNLDDDNAYQLMDILKNIAKDRLVIVVSHDKTLANKYASRIIKINKGTIIDDTLSNDDNKNINDNDKLIITKSHLSFKNTLLLSLLSFKKVIVRSILSFIALGISLGVFMCVGEILRYDENVALNENSISTPYKVVSTRLYINNSISFYLQEHLDIFESVFPKKSLIPSPLVDDFLNVYDENVLNNQNKQIDDEFEYKIDKFIFLDDEQLKKFDFDLIGELPIYDNEIVLTKFDLVMLNWLDYDDINNNAKINEICANRDFFINNDSYKISGIIDTNYNFNFSKNPENEISYSHYIEQYEYGLHNSVIANKNLYQQILNKSVNEQNIYQYRNIFVYSGDNYKDKIQTVQNKLNNPTLSSKYSILGFSLLLSDESQATYFNNFLSDLFLILGCVFLFFTLIILANFIKNTIIQQINIFYTLASLGLSKRHSLNIVILQSLIVSLAAFVFSLILVPLVIFIINVLITNYGLLITIYSFSFYVELLVYIGILVVWMLFTFLYGIYYLNKKREE